MNNFEKIKNMDVDEMTELFYAITFNDFICNNGCKSPKNCEGSLDECKDGIKQWLESEEK